MPDLPQYNNRDDELRPNGEGAEATAQAGRRIGAFYDQAGRDIGQNVKEVGDDFQQHVTMSQMSHGALTYAAGLNDLDAQWNDTLKNSDPSDPTVRQKFMQEKVAPFVQQWSTGFSTKQGQMYAAEHSASLIQHFNEKTIADMSTMSGIATTQNMQKASLYGQNTAYNDFSSVDAVIGSLRGQMGSLSQNANLSAEAAERLKGWVDGEAGKVLVQGYKGAADRAQTPEQFQALSDQLHNDQRFALYGDGSGDGSQNAVGQVGEYITHAQEVRNRVDKSTQEAQKAQVVASGMQDYVAISSQINALKRAGQPITPDLVQAVDAYGKKYGSVTELADKFSTLETGTNETITAANDRSFQQTNPTTAAGIYRGIHQAPGTPGSMNQSDIDKAFYVDKSISKADWEQMSSDYDKSQHDPQYEAGLKNLDTWVEGTLKKQFMPGSSSSLDPSGANILGTSANPNGAVVYAEAQRYAHEVYMSNINAGMSPHDAMQRMTDPTSGHSLLAHLPYWKAALASPNASVYFGGHPQTEVEGGPVAPPSKIQPNESISAYRKRIGL